MKTTLNADGQVSIPAEIRRADHLAPGTMHHENSDGKDGPAVRIGGASGAPVFKVYHNFNLSLAGVIQLLVPAASAEAKTIFTR